MQRYKKYKDSGVEWIGEIPEGWEVKKSRYLFEIKKRMVGVLGIDVLSITQKGIKVKDIKSMDGQISSDYSKYQIVEKGDFAMNHMDLLTGYVDISKYDGMTSPDYRVFSLIDSKSYDRFYLYLLQIGYHNKIFYAFGRSAAHFGRWRFPADEFKDFSFPYPPIKVQITIANFLDRKTAEIDNLIGQKLRLLKLYEEEKTAIINQAVTKGINPDIKLKASSIDWLGEIPEHWEVNKLKFLISNLESGVSVNSTDFPANRDTFGVLKTSCVYNYIFDPSKNKEIWQSELTKARIKPRKGEIIISRMNTPELVGASGFVESDYKNLFLPDRLWQTIFKSDVEIDAKWLSFVLKSTRFRMLLSYTATGASPSMKNLTQEDFLRISIPFPGFKEQNAIVEYIEIETVRINAKIDKTKKIIALQKEYRAALISEVVTGKIKVTEEFSHE